MPSLLRSVWDEPRPDVPPSRWRRDGVLVAALVALALLEGALRPDLPWRVLSVLVVAGLAPTLLWRRTRPLLMILVSAGVAALAWLATGGATIEMYMMVYLLSLPYSVVRWGSGRAAVAGSAIMFGQIGISFARDDLNLADAIGGSAVLVSVVALGAAFRYRAKARVRERERIKLLERERLARDLHDTVAHHVSAIAIRAQAGLVTMASQPDAAAEALRLIEAEAGQALAEMRSMVRVLRDEEPADLVPTPRISDLAQLAGEVRGGPAVEVQLTGDFGGLTPAVGTTIYRLAQESVTNARRHAKHATRIEVRVAADETSVHLRVSDDGEQTSLPSRGYGLLGMIERAGLLGGTCEAGPNPGRGWTVTAVLPRAGVAAA